MWVLGGVRCFSLPGAAGGGGNLEGLKSSGRLNGNNEDAPTTRGEAIRPVSFDVRMDRQSSRRMEWQWDTVGRALTNFFVEVERRNGRRAQRLRVTVELASVRQYRSLPYFLYCFRF